MHHAPQHGNDERQTVQVPIRPLPAVFMLIALAMVLVLDSCLRHVSI